MSFWGLADMAQRFGGEFSPDPQGGPTPNPALGQRRTRAGFRVNLLFLLPLPLIWKAFTGTPIQMASYLGALALMLLAAWLTREGLQAEDAFHARKVARRPALPRKILGAVALALGLGLTGLAGHGALAAGIFALLGLGLHLAAFGLDPLRGKGVEGIDAFQQDRVARAVDEAEAHLGAMATHIDALRDRKLEARLESFAATAREMFRIVEEDPRDLTASRRYLGVYLLGARDATIKFADLFQRTRDEPARTEYLTLLDDLEQSFAARSKKLLLDDKTDLDVEIEVLRERLAREGVARRQ